MALAKKPSTLNHCLWSAGQPFGGDVEHRRPSRNNHFQVRSASTATYLEAQGYTVQVTEPLEHEEACARTEYLHISWSVLVSVCLGSGCMK